MNEYTIMQYIAADCPEVQDTIGIMLHRETRGKICDTGCGRFNGGACDAYKKLVFERKETVKEEPAETVRQEAIRRGISISRVRKERNEKFWDSK